MNERIKELRKVLNLTMEKFGERVGVTRSAMSNIENGNRNLTEQMLRSICREFSVNEEWLRTGEGEMFVISRNDYIEMVSRSYGLDKIDEAIINTYMALDPQKRAIIKEYILTVAKNYSENDPASVQAKIDAEVEAYRKELESAAKGAAKSSAFGKAKENTENAI